MTIEELKNKLEQDKALKAEMLEAIKAGKEQAFLAAQGVEVPEKKELSDDELDSVAGGGYEESAWDDQGRPIRWKNDDSELYYTCPNCGRVLHKGRGGFMFCDPCDEWYYCNIFSSAVEHIERR